MSRSSLPTDDREEKSKFAITISGLEKEYKLYAGITDQALDVFGLGWVRFWRKPEFKRFFALSGIDLKIRHGERVGVIGRNGAGKTTLLKLITGNYLPSSGEIEIDGDVQALMQTGVGFHGDFTGTENIRSALLYNGLKGRELEAAVEDIIDFCELGEFIDQPIKTYSLGMKARLQFATATAIKPDIVIIDEVLGAGDAYFASKSNERMKRLTDTGATLLVVSHSMAQILQFSDRVVWIDNGKIVFSGEPLEVVNLYEEFIHKIEGESRDNPDHGSVSTDNNLLDLPKYLIEKRKSDNGNGADWGGKGPLKIQNVRFVDQDGNALSQINTGQKFGFLAEISSSIPGAFRCSCAFNMYNEEGENVAILIEPEREYSFDENSCNIVAWFDHNPIGQGDYILSAGLYRDFDEIAPDRAYRYHILGRGCRLRVISENRDVSRIKLHPSWQATAHDAEKSK